MSITAFKWSQIEGPTGIRTQVRGIRILCDNQLHYGTIYMHWDRLIINNIIFTYNFATKDSS